MVQAKLVNGCHIFLLSPSNSLSSLMKGGDKIAYAAYADWPTEFSDNAITSGAQQSVSSIVEVRNSGWQQETISSTYFSFNQSINALSLAMSDPHKRDLPVGGKINQDDKEDFEFFPYFMRQLLCEPEITCFASIEEISISIKLRPIDKLYTYLLAQSLHPPQPRQAKLDTNQQYSKKLNEAELTLSSFNQDLKKFILRQGPTEFCLMLAQICTERNARYYVNFGYIENCAAIPGGQARQLNASINQSTNYGDTRTGGTSFFQKPERLDADSFLVVVRSDPKVVRLALEFLIVLGSYQATDPRNQQYPHQSYNPDSLQFLTQNGANEDWKAHGSLLHPLALDQVYCSSLLSTCLYKYFARIVRPIWTSELFQVINEESCRDKGSFVREKAPKKALVLIIDKLKLLLMFVRENQGNISENKKSKTHASFQRADSGLEGNKSNTVHPDSKNIRYMAAIVQQLNQVIHLGKLEQPELSELEIEIRRQFSWLLTRSISALQVYWLLIDNQDMLTKFTRPQLIQLISMKVSSLVLNPASSEFICHALTLMLLNTEQRDFETRAALYSSVYSDHFSKSDAAFAESLRK